MTSAALLSPPRRLVAGLSGVTVHRSGVPVLTGLSWTVREGERWVVLGPNGAGKSTLLAVAAGALRPTTGQVQLLGEPLDSADLDDLLPRVGWSSAGLADRLAADTPVVDVVTTASYAALRRGPHPSEQPDPADEERARRLLVQVGCRGLLDRRFGSVSEGERKRVLLARALMTDPELLLLDEPAAGLDLGGREALLRMLSRLADDHDATPQVLVSHHVEEIPTGFSHALLLSEGRVVAQGPIRQALTSETLSASYGFPLRVLSVDGRWMARAALARRA